MGACGLHDVGTTDHGPRQDALGGAADATVLTDDGDAVHEDDVGVTGVVGDAEVIAAEEHGASLRSGIRVLGRRDRVVRGAREGEGQAIGEVHLQRDGGRALAEEATVDPLRDAVRRGSTATDIEVAAAEDDVAGIDLAGAESAVGGDVIDAGHGDGTVVHDEAGTAVEISGGAQRAAREELQGGRRRGGQGRRDDEGVEERVDGEDGRAGRDAEAGDEHARAETEPGDGVSDPIQADGRGTGGSRGRAGRGRGQAAAGKDDFAAADVEPLAVRRIEREGLRRGDVHRTRAILDHVIQVRSAGGGRDRARDIERPGHVERETTLADDVRERAARVEGGAGEVQRAARGDAEDGIEGEVHGAIQGVRAAEAGKLASKIEAALGLVIGTLQVDRIGEGDSRELEGGAHRGGVQRDIDHAGAGGGGVSETDRTRVDVERAVPGAVGGGQGEDAVVVLVEDPGERSALVERAGQGQHLAGGDLEGIVRLAEDEVTRGREGFDGAEADAHGAVGVEGDGVQRVTERGVGVDGEHAAEDVDGLPCPAEVIDSAEFEGARTGLDEADGVRAIGQRAGQDQAGIEVRRRGRADGEMRRGHARHRRRAGEFESEARLVRDAQDGRGQGQRAALDDLVTRERRRAGTVDRDGEVAEDGEIGRLGDVLDRTASVAVGGDGKAARRRDVAVETADIERTEAGLEDRRGAGVTEDVRDGDRGLRSGDLDVPQRRWDGGRTGEVEVVETAEDDRADAGRAFAEGERVLDAETSRSGEQAGAAGHADGTGAEGSGEAARDRHGAGADDEAARGGVDAAREGVLAAELQQTVARLGDAAVLDDAVDDEGGRERRHVATGDRDGADVHGEGRRAVEVKHAVRAGTDRLRTDDRRGRGVRRGGDDAAGEGEDAAGVQDDAAAAAIVEGERGQTVRAGQVRLSVARHEDGLLRDQAAIARVGVGEGVERVGTGGDVRAAGDGERIASDVDAGDILVGLGSGDAPDRHADREPGDDGRGGGDGGAACGRGRADDAEERVIGGLAEGAVVDDDAPGAETAGRVEVDGRGIDDRTTGIHVGAGEGQRRVRLTAIGAGDDEPDGAGGAVVDDMGGEQAAAAIVPVRRVPDVEIGRGADDARGDIAVADGHEGVPVVMGHHQAAVAEAQGITLKVVVGVSPADVDGEGADGGVRQHRHEAGLGGVDVVGVGREAVETGAGEAWEARTVDAADAVDRVEAGEDAIDDGPRADQPVGEGRGVGDLDAAHAEADLAHLVVVVEP